MDGIDMPDNIISNSNPALQQSAATATAPTPAPAALPAETQASTDTESTVQISQAAIQQLNSERSASSGVEIPSTLTGEVSATEAAQTPNGSQQSQPQAAPADNGSGPGQLVNLYA
ncbi:MAG: hypothetical protein OEX03_08485 [Gammaproteobacteria bacterium]|nr:hypothetical protein [Gammaproteobacteria bacterium]